MLRLLFEYGCSVTHPDGLGRTPLQLAANQDHEGIAMLFLEYGADINYVGDSWAPLHAAAHRGHGKRTVPLLVRLGAEVNVQDVFGNTVLHLLPYLVVRPWTSDLVGFLLDKKP